MDQRSKKIVTMIFEQNASQLCEVVDSSTADVALIDMDGANHREELDLLRRSEAKLPIIAISIKPLESEGVHFLRKPLSLPVLLDLLKQIFSEQYIQKAAGDGISTTMEPNNNKSNIRNNVKPNTGVVADVLDKHAKSNQLNATAFSESDDLFFDPELYTLAFVLRAIKKSKETKKQIVVKIWDGKAILVDSKYNKILTDIPPGQMRSFGVVIVNQHNTKVKIKLADPTIQFDFDPKFNSAIRVATIDEFVWQLAYITARGRIPSTLNDDTAFNLECPVYINEWPNFTRMAPIPHAIRVIAFWIKQPTSLCKLANLLKVDEEHINGLFFACHSIGIAGQATRQSDNIMEPNFSSKHKHRSLFGALLSHLKGRE